MVRVSKSFRQILTNYLAALPSSTLKSRGIVMDQIWCCLGKTSIFSLLVCLYWQVEYSGAGHDWNKNLKCMWNIFNAILSKLVSMHSFYISLTKFSRQRSKCCQNEVGQPHTSKWSRIWVFPCQMLCFPFVFKLMFMSQPIKYLFGLEPNAYVQYVWIK